MVRIDLNLKKRFLCYSARIRLKIPYSVALLLAGASAVPAELTQAYPRTGKLSSAILFYSKRKREILFQTPQYMYAEVYFRFQSVMSI